MTWLLKLFGFHQHRFVAGLGMFGDAETCINCGYSKYPESLNPITSLTAKFLPSTPENLDLAIKAREEYMKRLEDEYREIWMR